eukprot:scaffold176138_cov32-Prasinocladus_malaysianus.AAC.1
MQVVIVKAVGNACSTFNVYGTSKQELKCKEVKVLLAACFNLCNEEGISTYGNAGKIRSAFRLEYTRQLSPQLCR